MKRYGLPLLGVLLIIGLLTWGVINLTIESISPIGKVTSTRVNISETNPANCTLTIPAGDSQFSFFCIPNGESLENGMNISYNELRTYEATDSSDPWKVHKTGLPSWVVQDLEVLRRDQGYFINTNNSQTYFYEGGIRLPNSITLVQGWNYVGYPVNATRDIVTSLATIDGNYVEVRSFNNSIGAYQSFIPPASGDLQSTITYQTYWINMSTGDVWIVS